MEELRVETVEESIKDGEGGSPQKPMQEKKKLPKKKILVVLGIVLGVFLVVFGFLGLILGIPLYKTYQDGMVAYSEAKTINVALKDQDVKKLNTAITNTNAKLAVVQNDLKGVAWATNLPIVGAYISDATHGANAASYGLEAGQVAVKALEPYADLLGLDGKAKAGNGTTEDRISKLVETLDKITPQIDAISKKMDKVETEVAYIDPNRYPVSFGGKQIRGNIIEAKELVALASQFLKEAKPLAKDMPALLGADKEAKYMVIFQNDKELRPTGGFITAYAVFNINKGKISLDKSDDIYKLDDTITKKVSPPEPISKYLNVFQWRLRDANFSPDYGSSAKTFLDIYNSSTSKKDVKGVIAMDTQGLVGLMDVLGPVNIYGTNFTTQKVPACDCPMVVYELLKQAGQPRNYWTDNRKDMIGVLLQAIMKKALDAPSEVNGPLFQQGLKLANEKHILFFLTDENDQKGVESLGFAGKIKTSDGDYLHINDANLGGAKSNLYITQAVKQDVKITDSGADEILTIDYKYPRQGDNCSLERKEGLCLAGIYRDYLRIYLPKGSKVNEVRGFETAKPEIYEDLGHTVVAGFFTVVPQGLAKIQVKYSVPGDFRKQGIYTSLIQKQPGTAGNPYTVMVDGQIIEDGKPFDLTEDKKVNVSL